MALPPPHRMLSWLIPGLLLSVAPVLPGALLSPLPVLAQLPTPAAAKAEADRLLQQGTQQQQLSQFEASVQSCQQALQLYRTIKDRRGEGNALGSLGLAYDSLGNYAKAIEYHEQSLAIAREIKNRLGEGHALGTLGIAYVALGNYAKAIEYQEQSLAIAREIKDRRGEGKALGSLGFAYYSLGDYTKAIEYQEKSLTIAREIKNRLEEGHALGNLGLVYNSLGNYAKAIEYQEQSLTITREIRDRRGEGGSLNDLGLAYYSLGNYAKAIEYQEQSLAIAQEIKDRLGEGISLSNVGSAYSALGNYAKTIEYYQQSLAITQEIKDRAGEGTTLGDLGIVYSVLGNYAKAIEYHEQSLAIAREIRNRPGEGQSLGNLGIAYYSLGNYAKAIEYQEQSLAIAREIKDRRGEGGSLNDLGSAYNALGNYAKAIDYQEQSLAIAREIKDRLGEEISLGTLGFVYSSLGNDARAIEYYEQYLAIAREIKDRQSEGIGLNNLGATLAKQQQPELAIIFYKQSVSVRETIRGDIRTLPREAQESYTQTVAGTYRALADLLLAQGRVLEAQQVLELLKIQELRNYTRDTRAGGETKGAPLNAIEAPVVPPFDDLIALGIKLTTCEGQTPRCAERDQLLSQRDQATTQFNQQADRLRTLARQGRDKDPAQLQQEELTVAAYKIVQAQPKTVLIYPLVLEDKLWLVYGLQAGKQGVVFASQEIPVKRKDLAATVTQFRQLLENPNSDIKELQQVSQKLYGWLVAPLRPQLDANGIQNLVFSLDRSTRYIPLAALHDGKQYLAQRFSLATILTAGLTDTQDKLSKNLADNPVLGLGLSNAAAGFSALPNVVNELNAIVRTSKPNSQGSFPGTERLNGDFTLKAFKDILDYRILHLATHGKFDSEDPEKSFLVLGDGSPLKVTDIKNMNDLGGIHLVVLSACETAQGGPDKEGIEVSGLSYYFLTKNVKSVMASLWKVNDASTSQLMQQFYQNLATGKMSKAEALRQAQISLMTGQQQTQGVEDRSSVNFPVGQGAGNASISRNLSHPYYWAPFILIGNGL